MKVTIPLDDEGHLYREVLRIRVTVSVPGGDQPIWAFAEAKPGGTPWVAVAHSRGLPSRLLLPVVPGIEAPYGCRHAWALAASRVAITCRSPRRIRAR